MRVAATLAAAMCLTAAPGHADEVRLSMAGAEYAPTVIEASVGDILVFVNDDDTAHNVFIPTIGFAADLGKQDVLSEATLLLAKAGMFDVECVLHENMHARVVVQH